MMGFLTGPFGMLPVSPGKKEKVAESECLTKNGRQTAKKHG